MAPGDSRWGPVHGTRNLRGERRRIRKFSATYPSRRRTEVGKGNERQTELTDQPESRISLSTVQFGKQVSVDVHRRSDFDHVIELRNVLIPEPNATVADRSANRLRFVGAVQRIAVSEDEPMGAQYALELALVRAEGRDQKVAAGNDLAPLLSLSDRRLTAIRISADDIGSGNRDLRSVPRRHRLAPIEAHDAEPALPRLFHEVPIGWDPRRILLLGLHDQPAPRRLELPLCAGASRLEHLAAPGCDLRREQDAVAQLVPEAVILDADDDVGLR